MPPPRRRDRSRRAAESLVLVAPLLGRWLERLLAGHEPPLTVAQYETLKAVAGGETSGAELARRSGVSGPAVSQLLAGLAEAGLVGRGEPADDRRRHPLTLTDAGRQVLRSADELVTGRVQGLLADLPGPEADALARALPYVAAGLAGTPPPRRPPPPPRPHPPRPRPDHGPQRPPARAPSPDPGSPPSAGPPDDE